MEYLVPKQACDSKFVPCALITCIVWLVQMICVKNIHEFVIFVLILILELLYISLLLACGVREYVHKFFFILFSLCQNMTFMI